MAGDFVENVLSNNLQSSFPFDNLLEEASNSLFWWKTFNISVDELAIEDESINRWFIYN